MKKPKRSEPLLSRGILLAACGIAILLCILAVLLINAVKPIASAPAAPTAELLIIPAPSQTATLDIAMATATPTLGPLVNGIGVGTYVQIAGTEGEGLRLRSGPGISQPARFIGLDAEVFKVVEGPKVADEYTWWFLVAPYDESRSGWAAANYLTVVDQPEE